MQAIAGDDDGSRSHGEGRPRQSGCWSGLRQLLRASHEEEANNGQEGIASTTAPLARRGIPESDMSQEDTASDATASPCAPATGSRAEVVNGTSTSQVPAPEVPFADKMQIAKALLLEIAACRKVATAIHQQRKLGPWLAAATASPKKAPRPHDLSSDVATTGPLIHRDEEKGTSCPIRTSFTAMVLPRWESLEVFDIERIDIAKLKLVVLADELSSPALACTDCGRPTGPGEAILTLSCMHHFCPQCFEEFLRRQWADLAAKKGADLEKEQVPCPACGCMLGRPDVHTLNYAELTALARRRRRLAASPESLLQHRRLATSSSSRSISASEEVGSTAKAVAALATSASASELPSATEALPSAALLSAANATRRRVLLVGGVVPPLSQAAATAAATASSFSSTAAAIGAGPHEDEARKATGTDAPCPSPAHMADGLPPPRRPAALPVATKVAAAPPVAAAPAPAPAPPRILSTSPDGRVVKPATLAGSCVIETSAAGTVAPVTPVPSMQPVREPGRKPLEASWNSVDSSPPAEAPAQNAAISARSGQQQQPLQQQPSLRQNIVKTNASTTSARTNAQPAQQSPTGPQAPSSPLLCDPVAPAAVRKVAPVAAAATFLAANMSKAWETPVANLIASDGCRVVEASSAVTCRTRRLAPPSASAATAVTVPMPAVA